MQRGTCRGQLECAGKGNDHHKKFKISYCCVLLTRLSSFHEVGTKRESNEEGVSLCMKQQKYN